MQMTARPTCAWRRPAGRWPARWLHPRISLLRLILALAVVLALPACSTVHMRPSSETDFASALPQDTFPLPLPGDDLVGRVQVTFARRDDTLSDIARRYDLGYEEVVAANRGLNPWVLEEGTRVLLSTQFILPAAPRQGIVLNVAAMRLFYYPPRRPGEDPVVITHPIGIGREGWSTPLGTTQVVAKVPNPSWHVPASIRAEHARDGDPLPEVVRPGPDNPLGNFALRLGIGRYLIHGTNKPYGIGMRVSHGCIQLYPEDIATLFERVPAGTQVRIVNQPYVVGWQDGEIYLEAHKPLEESQRKARDGGAMKLLMSSARNGTRSASIDWDKAREVAQQARGFPIPILKGSRETDELIASAPRAQEIQTVSDIIAVDGEAVPDRPGKWYVQAGVFHSPEGARKLAAMLKHMGPAIPASYIETDGVYQVLAGPFPNKADAKASEKRIKRTFGANTVVRPMEGI